MEHSIIVMGAGGHGRILINDLLEEGRRVIGITDNDESLHGQYVKNIVVIGNDDIILDYQHHEIYLVNGVGMIRLDQNRQMLFERFKNLGYCFPRVIHPSAILDRDLEFGEGLQVMAGAIIKAGSFLGSNTIINTGVIVDHDCKIGSHVHLATGVTLAGSVKIGDGCLIGAGATIINGIDIGDQCLVAAGAVVTKNLPPGSRVMGVPARQTY